MEGDLKVQVSRCRLCHNGRENLGCILLHVFEVITYV